MAASSRCVQLRAMIYKNLLLKRRHWFATVVELVLPFAIVVALAWAGSRFMSTAQKGYAGFIEPAIGLVRPPIRGFAEVDFASAFAPRGALSMSDGEALYYDTKFGEILVAPDTDEVRRVMRSVGEMLEQMTTRRYPIEFVKDFASAREEIDDRSTAPGDFTAAIIFNSLDISSPNYTLRFPLQRIPLTFDPGDNGDRPPGVVDDSEEARCRLWLEPNSVDNALSQRCAGLDYLYSGFSLLQHCVDMSLIRMRVDDAQSTSWSEPNVSFRQLPKPSTPDNDMAAALALIRIFTATISLLFLFALSFLLIFMVNLIVTEKEKRLRQALQMAGLSDFVYWLSWFIVYASLYTLVAVASAILLKKTVFTGTSLVLLLLLFVLTGIALTMFGFVLTTIFDRADASTIGSLGILVILRALYIVVISTSWPVWVDALCGLTLSVPFGIALQRILMAELGKSGLQLSDLAAAPPGELSTLACLLLIAFDCLFYTALAYYLDKVLPKEHGTRAHPLFFLRRRSSSKDSAYDVADDAEANPSLAMVDVEPVPAELASERVGIDIRRLRKTYSGWHRETMVAVDDLSAVIYQGEITAIIGHNGAGKTTLANMLIGMTAPTSGSASVFGYDVATQQSKVRSLLGVCPQHDVLWDELNADEHLRIFARLQGVRDVERASEALLGEIEMLGKRKRLAKDMSGGERRRLSVATALIGEPPVIFLDEPSSGVDPYSRRQLWQLLLRRKQEGRVILITTHFMFEADLLADRKMVVSHGRLRCAGSSLFLKSRFGVGYEMSVQLGSGDDDERVVMADAQLLEHVQKRVPEAKVRSSIRHADSKAETIIDLPKERLDSFPTMLTDLESDAMRRRGVGDIGITMTTLEEVFLTLANAERDEQPPAADSTTATGDGQAPNNGATATSVLIRRQPTVEELDIGQPSFLYTVYKEL